MDEKDARLRLTADRDDTVSRIAAMTAELDAIMRASVDSNLDDEHDPEGSTIAFEREQLAGQRSRAESHLTELDAALSRLSARTYGRCEACGGDIGPERLEALPAARLCVDCARRRAR